MALWHSKSSKRLHCLKRGNFIPDTTCLFSVAASPATLPASLPLVPSGFTRNEVIAASGQGVIVYHGVCPFKIYQLL